MHPEQAPWRGDPGQTPHRTNAPSDKRSVWCRTNSDNQSMRVEQKTKVSGPKIRWSGVWSRHGRKRWSGSASGGCAAGTERGRAESVAHSPLQPNISLHWLHNIYRPHWTICSVLFQSLLFYCSCTCLSCLVTCSNLAHPFTYNLVQGILNKI